MAHILVRQNVEDFAKWQSVFNEHSSMRAGGGSKGGQLFQSADDPNEVFVLLEWDELNNARQFAASDDLRQAMERAGVTGPPDIHFLESAGQVSE